MTVSHSGHGFFREFSTPLVQRREAWEVPKPSSPNAPLEVRFPFLVIVLRVEYWSPSISARNESDSLLASALLGRTEVLNSEAWRLWPPVSGWPEIAPLTKLRVVVVRELAPPPEGIIAGIVHAIRIQYDGAVSLRTNSALFGFLSPYRRWASLATGYPIDLSATEPYYSP